MLWNGKVQGISTVKTPRRVYQELFTGKNSHRSDSARQVEGEMTKIAESAQRELRSGTVQDVCWWIRPVEVVD